MWSLGVIIYILLGGYPPFVDNNQVELFKKIRRGKYEFHDKYWGTVSQGAKDLISSLLTVVPQQRLSAVDALKKDWVNESDKTLEEKILGNSLQELKKFNAKRHFKAGVHAVRSSRYTDLSIFQFTHFALTMTLLYCYFGDSSCL
jgi:calcium/calmodulin-dependent protein kinase I